MQQLCYLAAEKDLSKLDSLCNELDIAPTCYAIEQVKSLTAFVSREKTLNLQNFIIMDLTQAEYSQEHILSAVQMLRRFSVSELIFVALDNENTTELYSKLAGFRVKRLIKLKKDTDYVAEVRTMLTAKEEDFAFQKRAEVIQEGMTAAAKKIACPVTIPQGLVMKIAVAGTINRIGTTTQTFALWHYIKSLGFSPAVQLADKEMFSVLVDLYGGERTNGGNYAVIRGIPFCAKICEEFNAYVYDFGMLSDHNTPQFSDSDISVLVAGAKPWELTELGAAMLRLKDCNPRRLTTLISFAGNQDLNSVSKYLSKYYASVPYHPDLWDAGTTSAYQSAVLPLVKDYCEDKS